MKIVIPVNEKDKGTQVCVSFGRAPYFMIYDTETKESEFLVNSAAESAGGAGIKAAQIIADTNADVLLTPRCGENAAKVLKEANIKMHKTTSESVFESINAFTKGKLSLLEDIHKGLHNHGEK